jgi:hypothetical protein
MKSSVISALEGQNARKWAFADGGAHDFPLIHPSACREPRSRQRMPHFSLAQAAILRRCRNIMSRPLQAERSGGDRARS